MISTHGPPNLPKTKSPEPPKRAIPKGRGWRMAVIFNGRIISTPTLNSALRDGATISGRFSQREVNQLAADLKADP